MKNGNLEAYMYLFSFVPSVWKREKIQAEKEI